MQFIIYTLLNYLNCSIKHDTYYDIARILLVNINRVRSLSLEQTASLTNVSISTLNRFFKRIGYYNFSTFRDMLNFSNPPFSDEMFIDNVDDIQSDLAAIEQIDVKYFDEVAKLIKNAKRIYVCGFGDFQYQAGYFQNVMLYYGKLIEIVSQYRDLNKIKINDDDLLIVTSIGGRFITSSFSYINSFNCLKVLITKAYDKSWNFDWVLAINTLDHESTRKYFISRIFDKILNSYHLNCSNIEQ